MSEVKVYCRCLSERENLLKYLNKENTFVLLRKRKGEKEEGEQFCISLNQWLISLIKSQDKNRKVKSFKFFLYIKS